MSLYVCQWQRVNPFTTADVHSVITIVTIIGAHGHRWLVIISCFLLTVRRQVWPLPWLRFPNLNWIDLKWLCSTFFMISADHRTPCISKNLIINRVRSSNFTGPSLVWFYCFESVSSSLIRGAAAADVCFYHDSSPNKTHRVSDLTQEVVETRMGLKGAYAQQQTPAACSS